MDANPDNLPSVLLASVGADSRELELEPIVKVGQAAGEISSDLYRYHVGTF